MEPKSPLHRLLYLARDWRSRAVFGAIRAHCRGEVLDVGGWDFYATAVTRGAKFERWTTLEVDESRLLDTDDPRVTVVHGDGCAMTFQDASFDTVLNLQVLEHVFEPIRMVHEIARVLRPGGHAIFLVPDTYRHQFINLAFESGTTLTLDGIALDTSAAAAIGASSWRALTVPTGGGYRTLTASAPTAVVVYGYDHNISYAYNGGLDFANLRAP